MLRRVQKQCDQMLTWKVANFFKSWMKSRQSSFNLKRIWFNKDHKLQTFWAILTKICHRYLSKIAQSGHTAQQTCLLKRTTLPNSCRLKGKKQMTCSLDLASRERFLMCDYEKYLGTEEQSCTCKWQTVWPDLAKFRNFGQRLIISGKFL